MSAVHICKYTSDSEGRELGEQRRKPGGLFQLTRSRQNHVTNFSPGSLYYEADASISFAFVC